MILIKELEIGNLLVYRQIEGPGFSISITEVGMVVKKTHEGCLIKWNNGKTYQYLNYEVLGSRSDQWYEVIK